MWKVREIAAKRGRNGYDTSDPRRGRGVEVTENPRGTLIDISSPQNLTKAQNHGSPIRSKPSLPWDLSPLSDHAYKFALANLQREEEMVLPIIGPHDHLLDFDDGLWVQRLLPIYDCAHNLIHPMHYDSLIGALVNVTVLVLSKTSVAGGDIELYLQVRSMEVLRPGKRER